MSDLTHPEDPAEMTDTTIRPVAIGADPRVLRPLLIRALVRTTGVVLLCLGTGALGGVLWKLVTRLPGYVVAPDGTASTSERGLTEFFGPDAWYSALGLVLGVLLGLAALRTLARLGWPSVLITALGATVAGLVCWLVGYWLGPGPFEPRLAAAGPGDIVPIELTLRSPVALALWPFGAVIPLLLWSSLTVDPEDEPPAQDDTVDDTTLRSGRQLPS